MIHLCLAKLWMDSGELTGALALPAQAAEVLPRVGELLHAVVGGADPDSVLPVHAQRDWAARHRLAVLAERGRTEPAGVSTLAAPGRQELPLRGELLDAVQGRV